MTGWELTIGALAAAGGLLVIAVLVWAAGERARVHGQWVWWRGRPERSRRLKVFDWCMAMSATLGAV